MKKVLFVCYGLGIGGIEKCLVNLINVMPENEYYVDLLLINPQYSELKCQVKRNVRFVDSYNFVSNVEDALKDLKCQKRFKKKFSRFVRYFKFRIRVKINVCPWKSFKPLSEKYDVAIAYSHHDYSPGYVIDKVNANRKVLWYHNGAYRNNGKDYIRDLKYYPLFDYVVAVSSDCAKVLKEKFTFDDNQLIVLRNVCDVEEIKQKAEDKIVCRFSTSTVNIVTVGRLTAEKGADLAVEACKKLCESGYNICWHWIGDGNKRIDVQRMINECGIEGRFVLHGDQSNPYPFVKNCDIYVQPSYYEAYSTTITEAKVLCKPIVTTDVGGMRDQLEDDVNGKIVPVNSECIADAVKRIINNSDMKMEFIKELTENNVINSFDEYEKTVFC